MNKVLTVLLITTFIKQLAWVAFIPLWQTPDEQAHYGQVNIVSQTGKPKLPGINQSEEIVAAERLLGAYRNAFGDNKYTYHPGYNITYSTTTTGLEEKKITNLSPSIRREFVIAEATGYPPLYYQLVAIPDRLFASGSLFDRVFAIRLATAFTLVALTLVAFLIGRQIFATEVEALVLATLVSFQPMLSFVHAGVTSDSLFNLLFAIFLYFCLRLINRGLNLKDGLFLLATIFLSYQTKPQANIMGFILIPALLILLFRNFKLRLVLPALALIFYSQWGIIERFLKGYLLIPETYSVNSNNNITILEHLQFTLYHTYREVLPWSWGVFRWLSLGLPDILRKVTNWLTIMSFVGFGFYLIRSERTRKFWMIVFLAFALITYFAAITIFDFAFSRSHGFSFGIQGRYFFPVIIPFMVIFLVGLKPLGRLLPIGMIIFNVITFFWVTGSYYQLSWPAFFIQASQYKPLWLKYPLNLIILGLYLLWSLLLLRRIMKKT